MKKVLFVISLLAVFSFYASAQHIPAVPNTPLDSAAMDAKATKSSRLTQIFSSEGRPFGVGIDRPQFFWSSFVKKIGFDSDRYVKEQTRYILERVHASKGRLYIECGGKLLHDLHASRVLPGFDPNAKMKINGS